MTTTRRWLQVPVYMYKRCQVLQAMAIGFKATQPRHGCAAASRCTAAHGFVPSCNTSCCADAAGSTTAMSTVVFTT
jgi:hypothetical protein